MASDAVVEAVAGKLEAVTPPSMRTACQQPMSGAAIEPARAAPGAGGGIVALLATYPLMTINTLQQTRGRRKQEAGEAPPPALSVLAELKDVRASASISIMTMPA